MKNFKINKNSYKIILKLLKKYYPLAQCALHFNSPEQLLVATILSAQCTDVRVNQVTPLLFDRFPSAQDWADASLLELEKIIRPTGFYHHKALHIKRCGQIIMTKYKGYLPQTMEELIHLPGVGRKTANVVLGTAFGLISGIVVDTHVSRLSRRMGFTQKKGAEQIEKDLMEIVPRKYWILFSHWMILHGRNVCKARNPACSQCFLLSHCPQLTEKT